MYWDYYYYYYDRYIMDSDKIQDITNQNNLEVK